MTQDPLILYGESFTSRLLLGTSRCPSPSILSSAVARARPAMLTASLRRQNLGQRWACFAWHRYLPSLEFRSGHA